MHYVIKKGVNNKTFYLNGLYYRRGVWCIHYGNIEQHNLIILPEHITYGIHCVYDSNIVIAPPLELKYWYYNNLKQFDDIEDFVKRVSSFLGY